MSQLSTKIVILSLFAVISCREKSDKKTEVVQPTPPNTCVTMSIVGQFPESGQPRQTYFYGCFEGSETWNGRSVFLADSACTNGIALSSQDFPYKKLDSSTCPSEGVTYSCVGEMWKVLGYEQPSEQFSLDQFKDYCASKNGKFEDRT